MEGVGNFIRAKSILWYFCLSFFGCIACNGNEILLMVHFCLIICISIISSCLLHLPYESIN
jgi:hypothetical protein